jgi:hypothetical protein
MAPTDQCGWIGRQVERKWVRLTRYPAPDRALDLAGPLFVAGYCATTVMVPLQDWFDSVPYVVPTRSLFMW